MSLIKNKNTFDYFFGVKLDNLSSQELNELDLNAFKEFKQIHKNKINLLMLCVHLNDMEGFESAESFLKLSVNEQNEQGESVIHFCCLHKKENFLNYLVNETSCDIN